MGFTSEDQVLLFQALAGILHLGNVGFEDTVAAAGSSSSKPGSVAAAQVKIASKSTETVAHACRLLGVTPDKLETALTSKEITAGGERYKTQFTKHQSEAAVEALAKAIYGRLFLWVVWSINTQIRADPARVHSFIGVLDIFGRHHSV
jgi:myosin heavy subunit